jgi:hypothetical protein
MECQANIFLDKSCFFIDYRGKYKERREIFMSEKNDTRVKSAERSLVSLGGSLYLNIPKDFVVKHNLKPGDTLTVIMGESMRVVVPQVA